MTESVCFTTTDRIACITLNRPESFNALDLPMARDLATHLLAISSDERILGVIITGAGSAFSAGGDIKRVLTHPYGPAAAFRELAAQVHSAMTEIRRMRKPVIAAINGVAAGGGFSLALACDFRVMATTALLKQGFTSNGLSIDGGATFSLPRLVGLARALEIAAFDEPIDAQRALAWGLVTRIAADALLMEEAFTMAQTLAHRSLHSFGWAKALLTESFETSWETQMEHERQGLISCAAHADGREGLQAFSEKRRPVYNIAQTVGDAAP